MKNRWVLQAIVLLAFAALSLAPTEAQIGNANSSLKGRGTPNTIAKWVGHKELGDSAITEVDGNVAIGSDPLPSFRLLIGAALNGTDATIRAVNLGDGRGISGSSVGGLGVLGTGGEIGISGISTDGFGVNGFSQTGTAVFANSSSGNGVVASTNSTDPFRAAIVGTAPPGAFAGRFTGDVSISGMLSKGGGSFRIDHPLDPENKYLYHSFVESPDMMNIYNGNITTNQNGEATVELPEYFEALNADFRYQLTVIGTFAQAIVAEKIKGNRFTIRTSAPNVEVSWQVTGVRQDGWAKKNRIQVEVEKSERERGYYLHPEAFDQPAERGVEWERQARRKKQ
ncbi:MAG: hypothetical protein AB1631_05065 [Acidobacteriota bacterium]